MTDKSIGSEVLHALPQFGQFLSAAMPSLITLFQSAGQDVDAALRAVDIALAVARSQADRDLEAKHGR